MLIGSRSLRTDDSQIDGSPCTRMYKMTIFNHVIGILAKDFNALWIAILSATVFGVYVFYAKMSPSTAERQLATAAVHHEKHLGKSETFG